MEFKHRGYEGNGQIFRILRLSCWNEVRSLGEMVYNDHHRVETPYHRQLNDEVYTNVGPGPVWNRERFEKTLRWPMIHFAQLATTT